ncbi:MAG: hypothetical protein PHX50_15125 [Massilibacteroides sp.]|nr:hypothetical protein [Massilibacteroides sp.]
MLPPCNLREQIPHSRGLAGGLNCKQSAIPDRISAGTARTAVRIAARPVKVHAKNKKGILDHAVDFSLVFSSVTAIMTTNLF